MTRGPEPSRPNQAPRRTGHANDGRARQGVSGRMSRLVGGSFGEGKGVSPVSIADELQKLHQLHKAGAINDDEFSLAKARVLAGAAARGTADPSGRRTPEGNARLGEQTRQWAMLLHFSLLAGFLLPLAGFILPILIWQLKKAELPGIDRHARIVVNWLITELLYACLFVLLAFVVVGIPLLVALGIAGIIFPIIGGIKANDGQAWRYPLSISFLPLEAAGPPPATPQAEGTEGSPAEAVRGAESDGPGPVPEDACLQCGAPIPDGAARCVACGWSYEESVTAQPGAPGPGFRPPG
jgi:uncharacterized Tic20 family protein